MTSVTWVSPASVNTKVVTYRYDAFDRRIGKEIDLPGGNGPSVPTGSAIDQAESFVYDGEDVALVYDEAGSLTHRYLHGPGIDNALADEVFTTSAYDDTYWLLPDHQGTIRDVIDSDNSVTAVVEHVLVDAFGFIADVKDGSGISKSTDVPMVMYVYAGMVYDEETGLYQVRHRYYDPENGVFITKDPIGFEGGDYNLYRWVGNDAVNRTDPTGEFWDTVLDVVSLFTDIFTVVAAPTPANIANVVVDAVALAVPGVPSPGTCRLIVNVGESAYKYSDDAFELTTKFGDEVVDTAKVSDKAADVGKAENKSKTYETYTKTKPETGEVYSGRTSGTGTPEQNVARRDSNHHMNEKGFGPAQLDKSCKNPDAIRGREQQNIEKHGGAKSGGGTSGNTNNGIAPDNPKRDKYLDAATNEFGG